MFMHMNMCSIMHGSLHMYIVINQMQHLLLKWQKHHAMASLILFILFLTSTTGFFQG